jgi:hypothetical protein
MARNVGLQILRGVKANAPTLEAGEKYLATDTNELIIGTAGGNFLLGLPVFIAAGTRVSSAHIVADRVTLSAGGTATVTLTGLAAFTSATSYQITAVDMTANHSLLVIQSSGTSFTITGTGSNVVSFICVGN